MRQLMVLALCAPLFAAGCVKTEKPAVEYVVPADVVVLEQGGSKEVAIQRNAKDAKDLSEAALKLTSSDAKLTAEGGKFKKDEKETRVTLKAAADAPTDKEQKISIQEGSQTREIKVKIEKKKG